MEYQGSEMNDSGVPARSAHTGLAWLPDLAESTNASSDGLLNYFQPVEHSAHPFVTEGEVGQQIISGGRGMGKSTLLLYRMRHLRANRPKSFQLARAGGRHGYRLLTNSLVVGKQSLAYLSEVSNWHGIWATILELLFAYGIARSESQTAADKLEEWKKLFNITSSTDDLFVELVTVLQQMGMAPHEERLHQLLQPLLRANVGLHTLHDWRKRNIQPALDKRLLKEGPEPTRWVLFVDCIDEALCYEDASRKRHGWLSQGRSDKYADDPGAYATGIVEEQNSFGRDNARLTIHELWIAAQVGYALAAHELRQGTGSLIALGSFRSETLARVKEAVGLTEAKLEGFILELDHDADLMRKIFDYNASELMDRDSRSDVESRTLDKHIQACVALCGREKLPNRSVFGRSESVYSLIRRHNFGTPRGLMQLGGAVMKVPLTGPPKSKARDPEKVVQAVNDKAISVFNEYRKTLFPIWDTEYEIGDKIIKQNVITKGEFASIEAEFQRRWRERRKIDDSSTQKRPGLLTYLRGIGLLGAPRSIGGDRPVQSFWLPGNDPIDHSISDDYLIVHPAYAAFIFATLAPTEQLTFYRPNFLADPDGPCSAVWRHPTVRLTFIATDDGAEPECQLSYGGNEENLFNSAPDVSSKFLVVLLVAHSHYRTSDLMGVNMLADVAEALEELRHINGRFGRIKATARDLIVDACSNSKHREHSNAAYCVANAKRVIASAATPLTLREQYEADDEGGNAFSLALNGKGITSADIEIIGLRPFKLSETLEGIARSQRVGSNNGRHQS